MIKKSMGSATARVGLRGCLVAPMVALVLALPTVAQAGDMVFSCAGRENGPAEANAELVKLDGQDKGLIRMDGAEIEAAVYHGLGSLVFIVIGDGFTMNYSVGIEDGKMDYSGTGSKTGFSKGTCSQG